MGVGAVEVYKRLGWLVWTETRAPPIPADPAAAVTTDDPKPNWPRPTRPDEFLRERDGEEVGDLREDW